MQVMQPGQISMQEMQPGQTSVQVMHPGQISMQAVQPGQIGMIGIQTGMVNPTPNGRINMKLVRMIGTPFIMCYVLMGITCNWFN